MNVPEYGTPEHHEYIALRRERAIAALTLHQRVARHWAWHAGTYGICAAIFLAYALLMWAILTWVPA